MSYYIPSNSMKTCKMKSRKQSLLLNKRMVWPDLFLGAARKISWPWKRFEQGGQCSKLYFTKMNPTISSHPNFFYDCATLPSRGEMYALFPRNWMGLGDCLDHQSSTKCHLWVLRIAYENVTHFLRETLVLGIQTSWCEEVKETHGEASQGEGLRIMAHSPGIAPANS